MNICTMVAGQSMREIDSIRSTMTGKMTYEHVVKLRSINKKFYYMNKSDSMKTNLLKYQDQILSLNDPNATTMLNFDWGLYYQSTGDQTNALKYYFKINETDSDLLDTISISLKSSTALNVAYIYFDYKLYQEALVYADKSVEVLENQKYLSKQSKVALVFAWSNAARINQVLYESTEKKYNALRKSYFKQAKMYFDKVYKYLKNQKAGDNLDPLLVEVYAMVAKNMYLEGKKKEGNDLFRLLEKVTLSRKDPLGFSTIKINEVECKINEPSVLTIIDSTILVLNGLQGELKTSYFFEFFKAGYFVQKGDSAQAIIFYEKAIEGAKKYDNVDVLYASLEYISNYYLKSHDYKKSSYYYNLLHELNNSMTVKKEIIESQKQAALIQLERIRQEKELELANLKVQRNQNLLYLSILGLILLLSLAITLYVYLQNARNKKKILTNELRHEQENLINLEMAGIAQIKQTIEKQKAVAENRKKIARNLHDDLASGLAALNYYIQDIASGADSEKDNINILSIKEETNSIYNSTRQYIHSLYEEEGEVNNSLTAYLINLIKHSNVESKTKIDITADYQSLDDHLNTFQQNQLYRIVKESVANSLKHSSSKNINIILEIKGGKLRFLISDDGVGFESSLSNNLGLNSIRDRVRLLNGNLEIKSQLNKGTVIAGDFILV